MFVMSSNEPKDFTKELSENGIQGFFVLTRDGHPLLERYYVKELNSAKDNSFLIAGFLAAISRFAAEVIPGLLSDIGFHTTRLHLEFTNELLLVLMYDEALLQDMSVRDARILMKGTLANLKIVLEMYLGSEIQTEETYNPLKIDNLRNSLISLKENVDHLLEKSFKEVKEGLNTTAIFE